MVVHEELWEVKKWEQMADEVGASLMVLVVGVVTRLLGIIAFSV